MQRQYQLAILLALATWREINAPDQSSERIGNEDGIRRDQTATVQAASFLRKFQHQFRLCGRAGSPTAQIESVQIRLMSRVGVSCTDVEYEPDATTGPHHHGELETVLYVVKGRVRMRWGDHLELSESALTYGDDRDRQADRAIRSLGMA